MEQTDERTCLVCGGAQGPWSREHVFPLWLLGSLGPSAGVMRVGSRERDDDCLSNSLFRGEVEYSQLRLHATSALQVGSVCKDCNSGWMSHLESSVKRFLPQLAARTMMPFELDRRQRLVLARWALKTALMLELATPEQPDGEAAREWFSVLRSGGFPREVAAYVGVGPAGGIGSSQGSMFRSVSEEDREPPIFCSTGHGFKTALHVESLYLLVAELPELPYVHMRWDEIHMPLWPPLTITGRYLMSQGFFLMTRPQDATIIYADSLSTTDGPGVYGPAPSAWVGDTPAPPQRHLTPEEVREVHRRASLGPYDW